MSGSHGSAYVSNATVISNAATFIYGNANLMGTNMYYDFTEAITRLNVMSGLKGIY